jgi:hypothetical protein
MLLFMLVVISTAYADWLSTKISTSPVLPEYAALIGLGTLMIALGAYGRRSISEKTSHD